MSHPYFYAVLLVVALACVALGFATLTCWVTWRDAIERRRDARNRRARREAQQ
jgi:hypothetical protein